MPIDLRVPAARARRVLLGAALEAGRALPDFAPDVVLTDMSQGTANYAVRFHVPDFGAEMRWRDAVAGAVQTRAGARRAGDRQAGPRGAARPALARAAPAGPAMLFDTLDLFHPFTAEERESLAAAMTERLLQPGAAVMRRGEAGETLGVLAEGVLEVRIARQDGSEWVVDRLFPGAVFGEMALLTGQPRSATILATTEAVVFELHRADIEPVLRARPAVLEGLTAIMAERQARNSAGAAGPAMPTAAAPTREDILMRLRSFFGIR